MDIQDFRRILSEFTGQRRGVFVHKIFIEMTGDLNAAAMLSQILYWSDKTADPDGWFYKTTEEWQDEICLSYYQLRRAYKIIKPLGIQHRLKRVESGATKAHYRVDWDTFVEKTAQHLDFQVSRKSRNLNPITDNNTSNSNQLQDSHRLPLSDKSDEAPIKTKTDVPKEKKHPAHHCVYLAIALGSFGLDHDSINGTGPTIGAITYGSKGKNVAGFLQIHFNNFTGDWSGFTLQQFEAVAIDLALAYGDWQKKRDSRGNPLSAPRDPVKIEAMLNDYLKSHAAPISAQPTNGFTPNDVISYTVRDGVTIPFTVRNGIAYDTTGNILPPDPQPDYKPMKPGVDDDDEPQF